MPVIGLTCYDSPLDTTIATAEPHNLLSRTYTDALLAVGAIPILLPAAGPDNVERVLDLLDGLVISGGGDIDPWLYGQENTDSTDIDGRRDAWELALVRSARRRGLPTLGICRGCQIVNVAAGGDLRQDAWDTDTHVDLWNHDRTHRATDHHPVTLSGPLVEVYGTAERLVNTLHHQSLDRIGADLDVVATAPDGCVEAVAASDGWRMLAVQWHPERMDLSDERPLFEWLVDAAG